MSHTAASLPVDLRSVPPQPSLRILLADDVPTNQMLIVSVLEERGHRVQVVADGYAAVGHAANGGFDVILMDLQMPEMDGLEATAAIRALPGLQDVPIIALTAHGQAGDRQRCLAAGMNAYLAKPLHLGELADLVELTAQAAMSRHEAANESDPLPGV